MTTEEWQILLFILMIVAISGELAYILYRKKRRKKEMFKRKDQPVETVADRAHNLILTVQGISRTLAKQGINTHEADVLLRQAKDHERAKDYSAAAERAEAAKLALLRLKREHDARKGSEPASRDPEIRPMNQSVFDTEDTPLTMEDAMVETDDALSARPGEEKDLEELPENYLQAKFMLSTARDNLQKKGITKGEAYDLFKQAERYFQDQEYSKALSHAIKADRKTESGSVSLIADESPPREEEIEVYVCPNCDEEVAEDDIFCRECGHNLEEELACSGCEEPIGANDKFCRKCGEKLK